MREERHVDRKKTDIWRHVDRKTGHLGDRSLGILTFRRKIGNTWTWTWT